MGTAKLQVCKIVYKITEGSEKLAFYKAGFYEQKLLDKENLTKQSVQNTVDHTLQKKKFEFQKFMELKKLLVNTDAKNILTTKQTLSLLYPIKF